MTGETQTKAPTVPSAKQGAETRDPRTWEWVEASVWSERMLTALGNGGQRRQMVQSDR